jgi:hypothetical protein
LAASWIVAAEQAVPPPAFEAVERVRFRMLLVARPARHSNPPTDANVWPFLNLGRTLQDRGSVGPRPEGTRHHSCWRPQSIKVISDQRNPGHELWSCLNAPRACDRKPPPARSAGQSEGQKKAAELQGAERSAASLTGVRMHRSEHAGLLQCEIIGSGSGAPTKAPRRA